MSLSAESSPIQRSPIESLPTASVVPAAADLSPISGIEDPTDITFLRQPHGGYDLTLRVAPLSQVVPHEHYHARRVDDLTARLLADGRLINPPIVAQQGEKFVVLDGATRLTAMRQLNFPYVVVQVVDLDPDKAQHKIELTSWNHVLFGGKLADLLAALRDVPGLRLAPVLLDNAGREELSGDTLGSLTTADGESFVLETLSRSAVAMDELWLHVLNDVVECYGQWGNVERTLSSDVLGLRTQFPNFAALVTFPRFTPQMILAIAAQGRTVPAGITRFVIPGRILRLNVPLEKLVADEPLAAKQAWLDDLIREKLHARQVRFYEEPVVLLDE